MRLKLVIPGLTLLFIVLFTPLAGHSKHFQENPLTKAIQLFDKGLYAEAEPLFKKLIDAQPDDFMLNYFYGVCRTNNGHYSDRELGYLLRAAREVNPVDIDYYIGVQQHARNNWEEALARYRNFQKSASEADQKNFDLTQKIEQCQNRVNPFVSGPEIEPAPLSRKEERDDGGTQLQDTSATEVEHPTTDSLESIAGQDSVLHLKTDSGENLLEEENTHLAQVVEEEEEEEEGTSIRFYINERITYHSTNQFKTPTGEQCYAQGTEKQKKLERTLTRAGVLRERYARVQSRNERDSLGQLILAVENEAYELKEEATRLLQEAKMAEKEYWDQASPDEIDRFAMQQGSSPPGPTRSKTTKPPGDSAAVVIPNILIGDPGPEKQATESSTADLVYKIQIGAFSRGIPNYLKPMFKKISLLRKVENYTDENGVTVYTTGNLTNLNDALQMQKQVRQEGAEDAFVVPYLKGKRITLDNAKEIEGIK